MYLTEVKVLRNIKHNW